MPSKHVVAGSNPAGRAISFFYLIFSLSPYVYFQDVIKRQYRHIFPVIFAFFSLDSAILHRYNAASIFWFRMGRTAPFFRLYWPVSKFDLVATWQIPGKR